MKKKVYVATENPYLWQKIYLILKYSREAVRAKSGEALDGICIWDVDTLGDAPEGAVTVSRGEGAALRVPFGDGELIALLDSLDGDGETRLSLSGRLAYLDGKEIKLTEVEASLLGRLISASGEFVSRGELLQSVWGDSADGGVLNVYIHYLREKLEVRGEKIILSSRSAGYGIDKKYLTRGKRDA